MHSASVIRRKSSSWSSSSTSPETKKKDLQRQPMTVPPYLQRRLSAGASSPKLSISAPGDRYEQEADRVAEQVMQRPAQLAPVSAPPQIQPRLSDSAGLPQAAPPGVDEALAGPGRPLSPDVRRDVEGRLGHDFSDVRLHTGETAARSADALGAQAYTVRNHVVFGRGQSGPEAQGARGLLAHELVHVAQQTGGGSSGQHVLARKLTAKLAGWGVKYVDSLQFTFDPHAHFESSEFSRALAAADTSAKKLGVIREGVLSRQSAATALDVLVEGGAVGATGTLPIKAGMKGRVTIQVQTTIRVEYDIMGLPNFSRVYEQPLTCTWDVEADLEGKLKISRAMPGGDPFGNKEVPFQPTALIPDEDAVMGYVQMTSQYGSAQTTDVPAQLSGGFESKGGLGANIDIPLGSETTYPPAPLIRTFRLYLQVTDIPKPELVVTMGPASVLREWPVEFSVNRWDISEKEMGELDAFVQSLSPRTRDKLSSGEIPITVIGKASATGSHRHNLELSRKRKDEVEKYLIQTISDDLIFKGGRAPGEGEAKTPNNVESDKERVVILQVWDEYQ